MRLDWSRLGALGAASAFALSWACCLPLFAGAAGLGLAAMGAWLAPWRPVLAAGPEAPLRVYAVWFDMVLTDSRLFWPKQLLDDPRVLHFWDDGKLLGEWYGEHPDYGAGDGVWWDTYLLYRPESIWRDKPSHLVNLGDTIYETREELRESLAGALAR